jgi:hypothetical protein
VCLALVCKQPKVIMSLLIIITSLAWTSSFLFVDATTVLFRFFVQLSLLVLWTQSTLNTNAMGVYFGHHFNVNKKGRHPDFSLHSLGSILWSLDRKLLHVLDIDNHFLSLCRKVKLILEKKIQHVALLKYVRSWSQEAAVKLSTLIITVGINYKKIKPKIVKRLFSWLPPALGLAGSDKSLHHLREDQFGD